MPSITAVSLACIDVDVKAGAPAECRQQTTTQRQPSSTRQHVVAILLSCFHDREIAKQPPDAALRDKDRLRRRLPPGVDVVEPALSLARAMLRRRRDRFADKRGDSAQRRSDPLPVRELVVE